MHFLSVHAASFDTHMPFATDSVVVVILNEKHELQVFGQCLRAKIPKMPLRWQKSIPSRQSAGSDKPLHNVVLVVAVLVPVLVLVMLVVLVGTQEAQTTGQVSRR